MRNARAILAVAGVILVITAVVGAGRYWYGATASLTAEGVHADGAVDDVARRDAARRDAADVVLDQEQRDYIWQIEHHVLILAKYWFHDLGEAWARPDGAALARLLAPEFEGGLPRQPRHDELTASFARVSRLKDSGATPLTVGPEGFVEYLLSQRAMFSGQPRVKVFAKTLVPKERTQLDGAWEGVGVARLWGETGTGKPGEVVLQFEFRIPRPERTGQAGWLRHARVLQSQTATASGFFLRDVTRRRGIDPGVFHDNWKSDTKISGSTGGVHVCDFNRDGLLDLLVVDVHRAHLFQGQKDGVFKDVTAALGLPDFSPPDAHAIYAAFADLDGDGWEDLILWGSIYRNEQGRFFKDYTLRCNIRLNPEATGIVVGDYDRDGKIDLYLTQPGIGKRESWLDGKSGRENGNQLWHNLGNWQFEDVTAQSNTGGGSRSVFSAVWLDANDDGWPDLYVPNEFGHGILLINRGNGTFRAHTIGKLPGDFGTMGITCGDINNDGKIDLYLGNMYSKTGARIIGNLKPGTYPDDIMAKMRRFVSGSQLYLNRGDLNFEPVGKSWQVNDVGWAYGPTLFDLDNDGFLDVFAMSGFMSFDRSEPDG